MSTPLRIAGEAALACTDDRPNAPHRQRTFQLWHGYYHTTYEHQRALNRLTLVLDAIASYPMDRPRDPGRS